MTVDNKTIMSTRPVRERRLPKYLEDYEMNLDLRVIGATVESPKKKRSPLKSTVDVKKKRVEKVVKKLAKTKTARASRSSVSRGLSTFDHDFGSTSGSSFDLSTPSPFPSHTSFDPFPDVPAIEEEKILGSTCKDKWALNKHTTQKSVAPMQSISVDKILSSCQYHPGKIHNHLMKPAVEIVFSFDVTGSMYSAIGELKQKLQHLLKQLLKDLPAIRIAIIAHGDYCDHTNSSYKVMSKLDFSNDLNTLVQFVQSVKSAGGGDAPECYELAIKECATLNWHKTTDGEYPDDISRVLVVIGDQVPHDATQYFKIDWKQELQSLFDTLCVKAYGVQCLNSSLSTPFYQALADMTYGTRLELKNFSRMHELIMGLCYRESAEQASIQFAKKAEAAALSPSTTTSTADEPAVSSGTLSDDDILKIHNAIHTPSQTSVNINGVNHTISVNPAECRFVRINEVVYIQQETSKNSKYAIMAREGHKVTWQTRSGLWGLIVDDEIIRR